MVKQICEKLEALLDYKRYLTEDDGSGFLMKTTFEEENERVSNQLFQDNYQFSDLTGKKVDKIAPLKESKSDKKKRLEEKANTLDQWYGMKKKTQLSTEEKNQLVLLKLKDYLNPKQHFKTTDMKNIPKFFQIGTFVDGGDNGFAHSHITRGQRKSNLANELIEIDREVKFTKKKFGELQTFKQRIAKNSLQKKKLHRARKHMKNIKKQKK